jgi:KEOPS complex subunit Cgi121
MELIEAEADLEDVEDFLDRLAAIGDEYGVAVQAFDARYVVDRAHIERAVALADRAIARGEAIARDRAVEILCYAAGRRQINRAVEMGVPAEGPVVVLVDAPPDGDAAPGEGESGTERDAGDRERAAAAEISSMPALAPAETLGAFDPDLVRDFFDVGEAELATGASLPDLVRERVALLVVEK